MLAAHIRARDDEQSTLQHLEEVGRLCAEYAARFGMADAAKLAGYLHDFGKLTLTFDAYLRRAVASDSRAERGSVTHAHQGAQYLYRRLARGGYMDRLLMSMVGMCVASHHAGLYDFVSADGRQELLGRLTDEDPDLHYGEALRNFEALPLFSELDGLIQSAQAELAAFARRMERAHSFTHMEVHLLTKFLFSCLIDADRTDTYEFMAGDTLREPDPPWDRWIERLEAHLAAISEGKSGPMQQLRAQVSELCRRAAACPSGVYRLSVPTGGGKTLGSLRFALEQARAGGKSRIIYIVPWLSVLDQNAAQIRAVLRDDGLILEHHSSLEEVKRQEDYNLLSERWSSPLIFTTMVQLLESAFGAGAASMRKLHNLADSILIFDEIQAVPIKAIHLFNALINVLSGAMGATVLLCSATQPPLELAPRGMVLAESPELIEPPAAPRRTEIVDAHTASGYTHGELAQFALGALERDDLPGALLILNTKRDALGVFRALEMANELLPEDRRYRLIHLSTSMCSAHRLALIGQIVNRRRGERVICVSTQLIEAGVDISMPCVIRALAGLDSIAQAAGRCNRHGEDALRSVYIVNMANENVKMLPDIEAGQGATIATLLAYSTDPAAFDGDLLSPKALRHYYDRYYAEAESQMDYIIKREGDSNPLTLYDLLGKNDRGKGALGTFGTAPALPMAQALRTAAKHFRVIDDNTVPILVPYGRGAELIRALSDPALPLKDARALLREAQRYTVNVFEHELNALNAHGALRTLPVDLRALDAGIDGRDGEWRFYKDSVGLTMDPGMLSLLSV